MAASRVAIDNLVDSMPMRGLFSSTMTPSSHVQAILPAQICRKGLTDVVFVYQSHIVLQEYVKPCEDASSHGRLRHVLCKDDFDSTILAADILGQPDTQWLSNKSSGGSHGQFHDYYKMVTASPKASRFPSRRSQSSNSPHSNATQSSPSPGTDDRLPPQVLVLTLRRGLKDSIAFLIAPQDDLESSPSIRQYHCTMPSLSSDDDRPTLRLGQQIAIEPEGRLIAVAARESRFVVYRVKQHRLEWQRYSGHGKAGSTSEPQFQPLDDELLIDDVEGTIHKIEFLKSSSAEPETAILLLVVVLGATQTQLRRYHWDTTKSLRDGKSVEWRNFPVPPQFSKPDLLLPLTNNPGFLLAKGTVMMKYTDVLTGFPETVILDIGSLDSDGASVGTNDTSVTDSVLWTDWARPIRREGYIRLHDQFMLFRDGHAVLTQVGTNSESMKFDHLRIDAPGDTVFGLVENEHGAFDVMVTASGLFACGPNRHPVCEQVLFDDWSPLADFHFRHAHRICVSERAGYLNLLHTAHEVHLHGCSSRNETVTKVWTLSTSIEGVSCLISSSPSRTTVNLFTPEDEDTSQPHILESIEVRSLQRELDELFGHQGPSIFAATSRMGVYVQVTSGNLRVSGGKGQLLTIELPGTAVAACFQYELDQLLLFVVRDGGSNLYSYTIDPAADTLSHSSSFAIDIDSVTCMAADVTADGLLLVAISTWSQGTLLVSGSPEQGMSRVDTIESDVPAESIEIQQSGTGQLIILGLRTGEIRFIHINLRERKALFDRKYTLGTGAVTLIPWDTSVVALCDGKLSNVECGSGQNRVFSHSIGFPHSAEMIMKLRQHPADQNSNQKHEFHVMTGSKVYAISLGQLKTQCSKHEIFPVDERRREIVQTVSFDRYLAVAFHDYCQAPMNGTEAGRLRRAGGRRQVLPKVGLVQPSSTNTTQAYIDETTVGVALERIKSVFTWQALLEGGRYDLLVVHTLKTKPTKPRVPRPSAIQTGRLYFFKMQGKKLKQVSKYKHDCPIDAVRVYSQETLILSSGKTLRRLQRENDGSNVFKLGLNASERQLHSPVKALAIRRSSDERTFVHMVTHEQVTIFEDGTSRSWESENHKGLELVHVLDGDAIPIVVAASEAGIHGFSYNDSASGTAASSTHRRDVLYSLFEANIRNVIIKMISHSNNWLIGGCENGSFHQFRVLHEHEWRLLRYVQNLAIQSPAICPFIWQDDLEIDGNVPKRPKRPLDPRLLRRTREKKAATHIDGDILRRITAASLEDLLLPNAVVQENEGVLRSIEGRKALLRQLAEALDPGLVKDRLCERLVEWMRTLWDPRV